MGSDATVDEAAPARSFPAGITRARKQPGILVRGQEIARHGSTSVNGSSEHLGLPGRGGSEDCGMFRKFSDPPPGAEHQNSTKKPSPAMLAPKIVPQAEILRLLPTVLLTMK